MKLRTLTRLATALLVIGLVAAVGFSGVAMADNLPNLPESSEKDFASKATTACLLLPTNTASQDWRNGAIAYNSALESLKRKEIDRAAAEFDTAIKNYPKNALAHVGRGQLFREEGKYTRALEKYSEAIKIAPGCFLALNNRCYVRAITDDLDAALADCNEALRLYRSADFLDSRGFVYLKKGDFDKAIADYDAALQIKWNHAHALFGRGKARLMKGDETRGAVDIVMAEHTKPDIAEEMSRYGVK